MKKTTLLILLMDACLLAGALLAGALTGLMIASIPDCPFTKLGLKCPACGGTRCIRLLFQGKIAASFRMNPYLFLSALFLALLVLLLNAGYLLNHASSRKLLKKLATPTTVIAWAIGFVTFGALRNLI